MDNLFMVEVQCTYTPERISTAVSRRDQVDGQSEGFQSQPKNFTSTATVSKVVGLGETRICCILEDEVYAPELLLLNKKSERDAIDRQNLLYKKFLVDISTGNISTSNKLNSEGQIIGLYGLNSRGNVVSLEEKISSDDASYLIRCVTTAL